MTIRGACTALVTAITDDDRVDTAALERITDSEHAPALRDGGEQA